MKKQIAIGCDHSGITIKGGNYKFTFQKKGFEIIDYGTNDKLPVDYPDVAHPVAKSVSECEVDIGILLCGTGQGVAITANKYKHVRAALGWNAEITCINKKT